MTGTIVNASLIVFGSGFYLLRRRELSLENQQITRVIIAGLVLFTGFRLIWISLSGGFLHGTGQLGLVFVSLSLGKFLGNLLRIQIGFNRVAQFAKEKLTQSADTKHPARSNSGFLVATALFCATPLAIIGGLVEGASGNYLPLLIKSMMDGMATISFTRTFGLSVALSAIPVLALQGTLTLLSRYWMVHSASEASIDALLATAGCLVFTVILLAFGIQRVRLGDYLPSLLLAPLLAQIWW